MEGENIAIELADFCSASIMSEEESIDHNQHSFIRSFIHSGYLYSASSRYYYPEARFETRGKKKRDGIARDERIERLDTVKETTILMFKIDISKNRQNKRAWATNSNV